MRGCAIECNETRRQTAGSKTRCQRAFWNGSVKSGDRTGYWLVAWFLFAPLGVWGQADLPSSGSSSNHCLGIHLFARPKTADADALFSPRPPKDVFEIQLALVRHRLSPGSIDGVMGPQTEAALRLFQRRNGLPPTGFPDETTRQALRLTEPPLIRYRVDPADMARLRQVRETWLGRSQLDRLDYGNPLELMSEWCLTHPKYLRFLNPGVDWDRVISGTELILPNARYPEADGHAAFVRISLGNRELQVCDDRTNVLAHFPCSIGRFASQRPVGRLEIEVIVEDPNYTFDPEVFPESEEGRRLGTKLILAPGPNNPVGVVWIGLSLPGYGIHGTPEPEKVGRTESHGCFRLANWNAAHLVSFLWISMPVFVEP